MSTTTVEELEFVLSVVNADLDVSEPLVLPDGERLSRLEACLAQPFSSLGGQVDHPSQELLAATLFYLIVKSHPLPNNGQCLAVVVTAFVLMDNVYAPRGLPTRMYELAVRTAQTDEWEKDNVVATLAEVIRKSIRPISEVK